jgi:hypothetical protein
LVTHGCPCFRNLIVAGCKFTLGSVCFFIEQALSHI